MRTRGEEQATSFHFMMDPCEADDCSVAELKKGIPPLFGGIHSASVCLFSVRWSGFRLPLRSRRKADRSCKGVRVGEVIAEGDRLMQSETEIRR